MAYWLSLVAGAPSVLVLVLAIALVVGDVAGLTVSQIPKWPYVVLFSWLFLASSASLSV